MKRTIRSSDTCLIAEISAEVTAQASLRQVYASLRKALSPTTLPGITLFEDMYNELLLNDSSLFFTP